MVVGLLTQVPGPKLWSKQEQQMSLKAELPFHPLVTFSFNMQLCVYSTLMMLTTLVEATVPYKVPTSSLPMRYLG